MPGRRSIAETAALTEPGQVAALDGQHIWTADYAEQRFRWRPKAPLIVLVLRVHRLAEPLTQNVPIRDHYAGCTSWTPMADLPPDPRDAVAAPVLDDAAFEQRRAELHAALPGVRFGYSPAPDRGVAAGRPNHWRRGGWVRAPQRPPVPSPPAGES